MWDVLQEDDMPDLEYLGEFWGELCMTPEMHPSGLITCRRL